MAKRFIINLFGESGAGKSSVLLRLKDMVMSRARYALEIAEGFTTRDRRVIAWYRAGRKFSGAVCICTSGDTLDIIKANISFFRKHFDPTTISPWVSWKKVSPADSDALTDLERKTVGVEEKGILVTASRKPLVNYNFDDSSLAGFEILDIPLRIDLWHDAGSCSKMDGEWYSAVFVPPEVLLFHINYILKNGVFKGQSSKKYHAVDFKKLNGRISAD